MSGNRWYKERRRRLIREFGGQCEECGTRAELEFAHVSDTPLKGRGRGLNHRVLDVLRYPDRYVLLCAVCHRRMDNATLVLEGKEGVRA